MFVTSHLKEIHRFRVVWRDDQGPLRIQRGFRVKYSTALGSLPGPVRFEATVTLDMIRFLGWEQLLTSTYIYHGESSIMVVHGSLSVLVNNSWSYTDVFLCIQALLAPSQPVPTSILTANLAAKSPASATPSWLISLNILLSRRTRSQRISGSPKRPLNGVGHPSRLFSSHKPAITNTEASALSLIGYAETMLDYVENSQNGLRNQVVVVSGSDQLAIATASVP